MRTLVLLLLLVLPASARTPRRLCAAACAPAVARCETLGVRHRACVRLWVPRCRREGIATCGDPTFSGVYKFTGGLRLNSCGRDVPDPAKAAIGVRQPPGAEFFPVQIGTAPTLNGRLNASGFEASEGHIDGNGCYIITAFVVEGSAGDRTLGALLQFRFVCEDVGCDVRWLGTMTRR